MKKSLRILGLFLVSSCIPFLAFAQEAAQSVGSQGDLVSAFKFLGITIGSGLAIGVAAGGCGIGQGHAVRGALEGISRNPGVHSKIFTLMIIGLALIESLAIYALLIAFLLIYTY